MAYRLLPGALAAKVPMVVGLMDYGTKTGGLGPRSLADGRFPGRYDEGVRRL